MYQHKDNSHRNLVTQQPMSSSCRLLHSVIDQTINPADDCSFIDLPKAFNTIKRLILNNNL